MRSLSRPVGALLLVAALVPQPGAAAGAVHPLDPAASAGVIPTRNIFENAVPLLNREGPLPSFIAEGEQTTGAPAEAALPQEGEAMNHGAMGHGAPQAATE